MSQQPVARKRLDGPHGLDVTIAAIARQTSTSTDVVKALYEKELSALATRARVKQYVSLIAIKRVRQQLLRR